MTVAHINRIATVVPPFEVHDFFMQFARTLVRSPRDLALFERMAQKSQIERRYCCVEPSTNPVGRTLDAGGLYIRGNFPPTSRRMALFDEVAPALAERAVSALDLGAEARRITHVVVTTCTGLTAPGIDLQLITRCGLSPTVERTMVGFMGCYAALNALKVARHIVRSEPSSRVLVINLELCTLHLQETDSLEQILSFLLFADGCAASLVTAEPVGLALDRFHAVVMPDTESLITWQIQELGFDMFLSGKVPAAIQHGLTRHADTILDGMSPDDVSLWAIHPGGRTVLDAVEQALDLPPPALAVSRDVLRDYGNMSSATVMFVLQRMLAEATAGAQGCAMAFGPGLTAETLLFRAVG